MDYKNISLDLVLRPAEQALARGKLEIDCKHFGMEYGLKIGFKTHLINRENTCLDFRSQEA